MDDSSSQSTINGNNHKNFDVHSSSNSIQPNTTSHSYINGMSIELSSKKSNQIECESSPLITYLNTVSIAGVDQQKDNDHDVYKTGKYINSGRKKIPSSLRRSASTVSDIQFMRRGKKTVTYFQINVYI